jgi:GNAT superfamily N-acetyltransferase
MIVVPMRDGDYESLLTPWWRDWGWVPPAKDYLPNTGFVLYDEDTPVCAAFLYMTNSKVAWIEWLVSNKSYRKKPGRREGILFLLSYMIEVAKQSGYTYITAIAENQHAINIYETLGFISDKGKSQTLILWQ